jgi:uncharacterized protein
MKVVCNTSPLLLLAKIQRLALLHELYTAILVPVAVLDELGVKPDQEAMQIQALVDSGTFTLQPVMLQSLAAVPATLGQGEREAIALAIETAADLVILDDRQGRRLARMRGLAVTGTVGVLVEARARGLVPPHRSGRLGPFCPRERGMSGGSRQTRAASSGKRLCHLRTAVSMAACRVTQRWRRCSVGTNRPGTYS